MKLLRLAALLAAAPPLFAAATNATDPAAPATALEYRSAFQGIPSGVEEETVDWKKANADVAQFPRGHIDLLKWEEAQGGAAAPASSAPAPAAAAPAPARPVPPRGHQHP